MEINGTYSDGRPVHVHGRKGGFVYFAFINDPTFIAKVPGAWVTDTEDNDG